MHAFSLNVMFTCKRLGIEYSNVLVHTEIATRQDEAFMLTLDRLELSLFLSESDQSVAEASG